jgi:hypothetical protein
MPYSRQERSIMPYDARPYAAASGGTYPSDHKRALAQAGELARQLRAVAIFEREAATLQRLGRQELAQIAQRRTDQARKAYHRTLDR